MDLFEPEERLELFEPEPVDLLEPVELDEPVELFECFFGFLGGISSPPLIQDRILYLVFVLVDTSLVLIFIYYSNSDRNFAKCLYL